MPTRPCITRGCPNLTTRTRCSQCEREWEHDRRADPWLTGRRSRPTPDGVRTRVLRRDKRTCQRCGAMNRPMEVHHVNGQRHDNRMCNLITLCPDCHRIMDRALGIWR
jgi:5-methylcytosine-specific restriction endonuclease McrA